MKNLAGLDETTTTQVATGELWSASVPIIIPLGMPIRGEVSAAVVGLIRTHGYDIVLERRWVYWSARVTRSPEMVDGPGLSAALAVALNDAPLPDGDRTRYSGGTHTLGAVVRADGYAGGVSSDMVRDWGEASGWHIDTQEGLAAFVAWCEANL